MYNEKQHFTGIKCYKCKRYFQNDGYNYYGNFSIECPYCGSVNIKIENDDFINNINNNKDNIKTITYNNKDDNYIKPIVTLLIVLLSYLSYIILAL